MSNSDLSTSEIPVISTEEIAPILTYAMAAKEQDPDSDIVVSLEGDPGTGKTSIPRTVAQDNGWHFKAILAPHLDLVEGKGYPVHLPEDDSVTFIPLDIWPTKPGPGILLIDEIPQALPAVQASLSSLFFGGRMGNYTLPEGWLIVSTGNLMSNKAATHRIPSHIKNRLQRYIVTPSLDTFVAWGQRKNFHPTVLEFLQHRTELLHKFSPDDEICPTMRKWQKVSALMKASIPLTVLPTMIAAEVGTAAGREFFDFSKAQAKFPKYSEVVADPEGANLVEEHSYINGMATTLGMKGKKEHASQLVTYMKRYPGEYQSVFLNTIKTSKNKLIQSDEIKALAKEQEFELK